jgi:hypothetical protein
VQADTGMVGAARQAAGRRYLQPGSSARRVISLQTTLVTQLVTQAKVINSGATVEMHSDKAEQWSG